MTVALITNSPKDVVTTYPSVPLSLLLPTGDIVMGAAPGWTSPNGTYSLVNVTSFVIPSGQMTTGDPIYSFDGGGNVGRRDVDPPQVAAPHDEVRHELRRLGLEVLGRVVRQPLQAVLAREEVCGAARAERTTHERPDPETHLCAALGGRSQWVPKSRVVRGHEPSMMALRARAVKTVASAFDHL